MINKKKNIFEDIDFNIFASQICEVLKEAIEKFWEQDIKLSVYAINDYRELRDEALISNIDFFSSQIKVQNHKPVVIRLSKDFSDTFLSSTLSCTKKPFKLTDLTNLEIKILNNFCEFIYKKLKDVLIPVKEVKLSDKSEKNINLIFLVASKENICSKIIISIPMDRMNFKTIVKKELFTDEDFTKSYSHVRIKAGSTKITLSELKNLAKDDIVVLENSSSSNLILISGEFEKKFNVKINRSLIVDIDNNENETEDTYYEVTMEKNLWDDIQIEINAEFEKVKMTIGELKQITKGQVVDLGSVFDNEIALFVEDKKVAKGELIIINDRYAVRLNEILSDSKDKTPPSKKTQTPPPQPAKPQQSTPKPAAKPQSQPVRPKVQQASDDEEFDYSDFEK